MGVKDCPFCGSDDIEFGAFSISADCTVGCENCGAGFCKQVSWEDMNEKEHDEKCFEVLKEVWNRRV